MALTLGFAGVRADSLIEQVLVDLKLERVVVLVVAVADRNIGGTDSVDLLLQLVLKVGLLIALSIVEGIGVAYAIMSGVAEDTGCDGSHLVWLKDRLNGGDCHNRKIREI